MQPLFIPGGKKRRNQTWKLKGWEEKKRGKEKKKKKNRSLKPYQSYVATMRLIERKFMSRRFQRHQEKSSLELKGSRISRLNAATFLTGWHVSYMLHTIFLKKLVSDSWVTLQFNLDFIPFEPPWRLKRGEKTGKEKKEIDDPIELAHRGCGHNSDHKFSGSTKSHPICHYLFISLPKLFVSI